MTALEAQSGVVNVTPGTYNPDGGKRVQLAWQRFSNFTGLFGPAYPQQPEARRRSGARRHCRVCPAACR